METKYDSLYLRNQLCFPLYLCSKEIIRKYTPILNELNLTYTQYVVMMYFWENEKSNVKEISKALLLDSGTLTPLLKKLEKKGYVTRVRSNVDERNLDVSITKQGIALRDKALEVPPKIEKCIHLDVDEEKTLYSLIYKVLSNIEESE